MSADNAHVAALALRFGPGAINKLAVGFQVYDDRDGVGVLEAQDIVGHCQATIPLLGARPAATR